MLASPRWEHLGLLWDEEKRRDLTLAWHRLSGRLFSPLNLGMNVQM